MSSTPRDLEDFMKRNPASVFVNEAQGNPLQPDVQYRGFFASPLLGLPQGIAVFQDGVRINEPFGDTVNWALIPEPAKAAALMAVRSFPIHRISKLLDDYVKSGEYRYYNSIHWLDLGASMPRAVAKRIARKSLQG